MHDFYFKAGIFTALKCLKLIGGGSDLTKISQSSYFNIDAHLDLLGVNIKIMVVANRTLSTLIPLLEKPSFTSKEASEFGISSAQLAYYVKTGDIERVGHGVYRSKEAPSPDDFSHEEIINAVLRTKGGIICLNSALEIYGLTEEMPRELWIAIEHKTLHRAKPPVRVVRMRNTELGKTTIKLGEVEVPIFDRERTIVDAFRYLSAEVAIKALKEAVKKTKAERIDLKKLEKYAKELRVDIKPYILTVTT